jgi:hypothetical protein
MRAPLAVEVQQVSKSGVARISVVWLRELPQPPLPQTRPLFFSSRTFTNSATWKGRTSRLRQDSWFDSPSRPSASA